MSRPAGDLLRADDRHVVLGLAGDDAGVAADAGAGSRSPWPRRRVGRRGVGGRVEARARRRRRNALPRRRFPGRESSALAFEREQTCGRGRQRPVRPTLRTLDAARTRATRWLCRASGVEADAVADRARARSAVAEREREDALGAGADSRGAPDRRRRPAICARARARRLARRQGSASAGDISTALPQTDFGTAAGIPAAKRCWRNAVEDGGIDAKARRETRLRTSRLPQPGNVAGGLAIGFAAVSPTTPSISARRQRSSKSVFAPA